MGGSPDINYPAQPSYGEGMREALEAQTALLTGTKVGEADFSDFEGGLQKLVQDYEAPLRQTTAQIDTDVLRQTILGNQSKVVRDPETGQFGIPGAEVVTGDDGEPQTAGGGRYQMLLIDNGKLGNAESGGSLSSRQGVRPTYAIIDTDTGGITEKIGGDEYDASALRRNLDITGNTVDKRQASFNEGIRKQLLEELSGEFSKLSGIIEEAGGDTDAPAREFNFTNPNTGKPLQEGDVVRAEDGMIDLLGDKRQVQEFTTRSATEEDVAKGLATDVGESITEVSGDRQAGFDAQGNFLGLSALAEDVQAGNLSRQRERDLADVERLSGRFQDVMEDYRPGTAEAVTGAREVLESQKDRLTGEGQISVPTDDTFGGAANAIAMRGNILGEGPTLTADTSFDSATVADPLALTANTQFRDELGTEAPDTLRSRLLADAGSALGSGLTDREKNRISEAFKARSTMMGRTFDQSAGIAEAEARVAEDRARQAQNRAFVQSVLGQEAGLQQGDITRGMAQESEQAGLQQRADMTDSQFLQQARAAEMQAGMQQDVQQAGIDQERDVLQAQLNQQQAAFNAEAAQQRALADQRQKQQAAQFGVGAEMDAERLNAQLAQQGALGYVDAATRLASLEDQTTMDPFAALLNRAGGGSLGQAGQVFGQANYGLSSGPQYLNPEAGLGYISQMAANEASMYGAQQAANASRSSGLMQGLGALGGGLFQGAGAAKGFGALFCWVAREVYGPMNPQWLHFREWMFTESPQWFFNLYRKFGERFANWISDKPRIKSIIRKWMDSKIGDK